ncbi:hypothetical protein RMATCC62417_14619 [Rhizopus microsporus]|nr:hypothetical protein RMATCC62417_14619 [Rhizopus microsporus]
MSSQRTTPEEFYYLRPSYDLRRPKKVELKDTLMKHDSKVLSRHEEIVHTYYAVIDSQTPIDANSEEGDGSDSDYCPGDRSNESAFDEDNGELREEIDAIELAHLYSDNSLSPESLRQLYEQRQAYSVWITTRNMIMAIVNTCVSYLPSNTIPCTIHTFPQPVFQPSKWYLYQWQANL